MISKIDNKYRAVKLLKAAELKVTPQRTELINEISDGCHLSIYQIYENMKNRFPSISMATIYKIIEIFLSKNIVAEIHISAGKKRYELKKDHHSHYICDKCGRMFDVYLDEKSIFEQMKEKGYMPEKCEIYFYGFCQKCRK